MTANLQPSLPRVSLRGNESCPQATIPKGSATAAQLTPASDLTFSSAG